MKKLMIAACAIAMAAVAQAATYTWSCSSYNYKWNSTEEAGWPMVAENTTAYFVFATTYDKDDLVADFQKGSVNMTTLGAAGNGVVAADGTIGATPATGDYTSAQDVYFVLFEDSKMFVSGNTSATYDSLTGTGSALFGDEQVVNNWTGSAYDAKEGYDLDGWYQQGKEDPEPTPEPTSAMLMLLGMAGLALRRKQK